MHLEENVPLAPHTSFRVGGKARWYCAPREVDELQDALRWAREQTLPLFLLGKGTNIVFSDAGFPGLVLHTSRHLDRIRWDGAQVIAEPGASLHTVVTQSVRAGFSGVQRLAGIPGTMGGGTYINAGAFDQELKDVIVRVRSCTLEGELRERDNTACGFGYRHSNFCGLDEIILETVMQLKPADPVELEAEMLEILRRRKEKQPLHLPNAGSMFKRPPGMYAGTLIEQCGLKGHRRGGAQISEKHANFTVNAGGASAQDIWDLSSEVIELVRRSTGVTLEREVIFVGEFQPWPR